MNLWRKLQKKREIFDLMLMDARMQWDKCPLVGSRNLGEQIQVYVLFLLPSSPSPGSQTSHEMICIHVEVYEACGARSWCPHTLAAFNMGACYCACRVLAGRPDNFVSRARVVRDTYGLRHDEYRLKRCHEIKGDETTMNTSCFGPLVTPVTLIEYKIITWLECTLIFVRSWEK